jgi:hypothetical protein
MKGKYVIVASVVLLVSLLTWTSLNSDQGSAFPESMGGLKLIRETVGAEAIESTRQLHGGSSKVQMTDAAILVYRRGVAESTIWVSMTENAEDAQGLMDDMNDAIDPGDGFSDPVVVGINGAESVMVYYTHGYGSDHYYYIVGDSVYWVSVSGLPDEARLDLVAEAISKLG